MLVAFSAGRAPFLFGEGKNCADPRGARYRGLYSVGSSLCRQSSGEATLSVCGANGRWTHRKVERC